MKFIRLCSEDCEGADRLTREVEAWTKRRKDYLECEYGVAGKPDFQGVLFLRFLLRDRVSSWVNWFSSLVAMWGRYRPSNNILKAICI